MSCNDQFNMFRGEAYGCPRVQMCTGMQSYGAKETISERGNNRGIELYS